MSAAAVRDSCRCRQSTRWATTENGARVRLNEDTVPAGTKGAFVLIGEVAFREVGAVRRLALMFDLAEPDAAFMARQEYPWHLIHRATCPYADSSRKRSR